MNSKYAGIGIIVVIAVILLIVLLPGGSATDKDTPQVSDDVTSYVPDEIRAIHEFEGGTHTLTGEVDLPTPCHTLTHDVSVAESFPEQVTINFETEVDEDIVCAQVITPTSFEVTFDASEEASIATRFNGTNVELTIVSGGQDDQDEIIE